MRAILRCSAQYKVDIVLPLVSSIEEVRRCKQILQSEKAALETAGTEVGNPGIGVMIEVPSAIFIARNLAAYIDFFCLGTNDLVQYLLAVDRDNDSVADWYQTLHPSVLHAIAELFTAAIDSHRTVFVCGEMAGSPFYAPILLGLGARSLSMNVHSIPQVRRLLTGVTIEDCRILVNSVRACETADDAEKLLQNYYAKEWADLFPPGFVISGQK
jgi:phosphoenolpyruvate-protein kinase (PTS system EI component)